MGTSTTRGLYLYSEVGEVIDIAKTNGNMELLDDYGFGPFSCTSSSRPSAPWEGMLINETDTNRIARYQDGTWRPIGITVVANLASRPSPALQGEIIYQADNNRSYKAIDGTSYMPMESYNEVEYFESAGLIANGTVVIPNHPFPAWGCASKVIVEIDGQMGFAASACRVGVGTGWTSPLSDGTILDSQRVYCPAAQWTTVHHTAAVIIPANTATSEARISVKVDDVASTYYRLTRKITRLPVAQYVNTGE